MINRILAIGVIAITLISCNESGKLFVNLDPKNAGIEFSNDLVETDDFNILDYLYFYNGGGVAIGDINNDGLLDIFLSGNQVSNKLYLNRGELKFEDITKEAGVAGNSDWNTGVTMADVNGDGLLDIYVCAVVGLKGLGGHNELYINNGDQTFTERAEEFGLNFDTYSSSASFFDYDLDGDLDLYLLNHAIHTQESFGHSNLRNNRNYETGDRLMRNDDSVFTDVSEEAGIFGGVNGYGLGIAVLDFNSDGYPDIYVANDFHEDDYFYVNNGDGTFSERAKEFFSHTSRFSMGLDVADINHDGKVDILSLDMLPEDEEVLKRSQGDEDINIQRFKTERFDYHYQYSRNMLQLNQEDFFEEIGLLSNVAATDWSWSILFADFDNDSNEDIFISNGIPRRPNDLDYIKFVSSEQITDKMNSTKLVDQEALEMMPGGAVNNYIYKGSGELAFEDFSEKWIPEEKKYATATAMGDLDNDGDLDLVINNVNSSPSVYINQTDQGSHYIRLKPQYSGKNRNGIGTKAYLYCNGNVQYKELFVSRGFQASSEPIFHFGLGQEATVDSIRLVWPDRTSKVLLNVGTDQTILVDNDGSRPYYFKEKPLPSKRFQRVKNNLGLDFKHSEDRYIDFDRQRLMPYLVSDRGPGVKVADLNDDGLEDVFFGSSKFIPSRTYFQTADGFEENTIGEIHRDSVFEVVAVDVADFSNDGKSDIILGTGGADFYGKMEPLLDAFYVQNDSGFIRSQLPDYYQNASVIVSCDYDNDQDVDVFIGSHTVSGDFGAIPPSYILENNNGSFMLKKEIEPGMVTDAIWADVNEDGQKDLIVVGEWMSPMVYLNDKNSFYKSHILDEDLTGLWRSIDLFDIDKDGDKDIVLGNWGTNSKFTASQEAPLRMYQKDFDGNGATETIVAYEKEGEYYPLESFDNLAMQMVVLKKKYTSYKDFAGKSVREVFGDMLNGSALLEVNELRSGFLRNNGKGEFEFVPFGDPMQVAPITSFLVHDFNNDGIDELLVAGNYFGVKPYHGRFGSFPGALISDESSVEMGHHVGLDFFNRSVRSLDIVRFNNEAYLMATINNDSVQVYQFQ